MGISRARRRLKQDHINDYLEKDQFKMAGLQFVDMAKDAVDTFKPYKSKWHLGRDLLQPLRGIAKLALALLHLAVYVPFALVLGIIADTLFFGLRDGARKGWDNFKKQTSQFVGAIAHSIALLVRGATQLVTTPLTWLRAIGRGIYAAVKGWQDFSENAGVKRLVADGKILADPTDDNSRTMTSKIIRQVHGKMRKALQTGQPISVDPEAYKQAFSAYSGYSVAAAQSPTTNLSNAGALLARNYFKLFEKEPSAPQANQHHHRHATQWKDPDYLTTVFNI